MRIWNLRKPGARTLSIAATVEIATLAMIALACSGPSALAGERLMLANGFDVVCDHHATVDGRVRVFLKAANPDYFELQAEAVTGIETMPDMPVAISSNGTETDNLSESVLKPAGIDLLPKPAIHSDARLSAGDLHELLSKAGSEHNVDEDLLASLVKAESGGHTHAISRTGAQGLMQLMPGTAKQLGVADSFQPEQNVRGGTAYLDSLLTRYHDNIVLAVAAYNAGPGAVDRYHGIPPYRETRAYVARVVHEFNKRVAARRRGADRTVTAALVGVQ